GSGRGQPAVHLVEAAACAYGRRRRGQAALARAGEVHVVRRHGGQPGAGGETGEGVVVRVVGRVAVVEQLDGHVLAAEQLDQATQLALGGRAAPGLQRLADRALAAAGQDRAVTRRTLGELGEVVGRAALLLSAQLCLGQRLGEAVVALL